MHSRVPGILERTARLRVPASTSTSTTPEHYIAEGWRGDSPSWAPAPGHPGLETKASSPLARIAARVWPLALELRSKFPAKYAAAGDKHPWPRIPARRAHNPALSRSEPLREPAALAAPSPPLRSPG